MAEITDFANDTDSRLRDFECRAREAAVAEFIADEARAALYTAFQIEVLHASHSKPAKVAAKATLKGKKVH